MPFYDYRCEDCGYEKEEFHRINDDPIKACVKCESLTYHKVPSIPHTENPFHKPIELMSIGMEFDEEIIAFKEQCPEVDVSMDQSDPLYGIPVARNRKQKLAALDAAGFEEKK